MAKTPKPKTLMQITLHPRRGDEPLLMERQGETLVFNGTPLDLSTVTARKPIGRFEAGCDWLAADVRRIKGVLHVAVLLPHGATAPAETLFPKPLSVDYEGSIPLPHYDATMAHSNRG